MPATSSDTDHNLVTDGIDQVTLNTGLTPVSLRGHVSCHQVTMIAT